MKREAPSLYCQVVQQGHSTPVRVDVSGVIRSLDYGDEERAASKLDLSVDNFDLRAFDEPTWRKGNSLEVQWGYVGQMSPVHKCVIQEVKGFRTLKVVALSRSILMAKQARIRKWVNVRRSDVVRMIARENGYGEDELQIQDSIVIQNVVHQVSQTDAALLKDLARREGFQFYVDWDGFHWHERRLGQRPVRLFTYYLDPGRGEILDIDVKNDVTAKPASVTAHGRDPLRKENYSVTGDDKSTTRTGLAPVIEIVDPRTGASTLQAATGTSVSGPTTEQDAATAKRAVDAAFKNHQLTTVQLEVKAEGDPRMTAKTVVEIQGIRSLSGRYYVTQVKHSISSEGYQMSFACRRDGKSEILPRAQPSSATQNNKDPKLDPNTLTPKEVIDPRTGKPSVVYVDSHGREQG